MTTTQFINLLLEEAKAIKFQHARNPFEKLSAREYACIHLRVPDSGSEWLDVLVAQSRQLDADSAAHPQETPFAEL